MPVLKKKIILLNLHFCYTKQNSNMTSKYKPSAFRFVIEKWNIKFKLFYY